MGTETRAEQWLLAKEHVESFGALYAEAKQRTRRTRHAGSGYRIAASRRLRCARTSLCSSAIILLQIRARAAASSASTGYCFDGVSRRHADKSGSPAGEDIAPRFLFVLVTTRYIAGGHLDRLADAINAGVR